VHNSMFDVWMMLVFGVAGYVFNKLGYPLPPLVLAIVLGDRAEEAFRQALLTSQGNVSIFWSNWLVGSIMGLGLVLLCWPLLTWLQERMRSGRAVPQSAGAAANPHAKQ
jgi:putative tricarboxylic transport membrane protein